MLENYGLNIIIASNGNDAISVLNNNPDTDLVLMDVMMPGMNGLDATREIRMQERFNALPIIALTAKAMKDDYQNSIEAGMNDYISKPIDINELAVTKPVDSSQLLELMNNYFG